MSSITVYDGARIDMRDSTGNSFLHGGVLPHIFSGVKLFEGLEVLSRTDTEVVASNGSQTFRFFGTNLTSNTDCVVQSALWYRGDTLVMSMTDLDISGTRIGAMGIDALFGGAMGPWLFLLATDDVVSGADLDDVLIGFDGDDRVFGNGGDDVLFGDALTPSPIFLLTTFGCDDILDGGTGADVMDGGFGDDTYHVDDVRDRVIELKPDIDESSGRPIYRGAFDHVLASVSYSIAGTYVELLTLTGGADIDATGNSLRNTLTGNTGVNILTGGKGDDTYWVQTVGDRVVEKTGEGFDVVHSSVNFTLAGQFIEDLWLEGDGNLTGQGNSLDNYLRGNAGINLLAGGKGNDRYYIQNVGDRVIEKAGEGVDEVFSAVSFSLAGQYIENLTLAGDADLNGTGNSFDNHLRGNAGKNILAGGRGDDSYEIQTAGDKAVEAAGEGTDIVYASVTYSLAGQHIENLTLFGFGDIDATGNSYDNVLTGNIGQNELIGGKGDDTYYVQTVGDIVRENDKQGYDTVFSSVSFSLGGQFIEELALTGTADINADGNSLSNRLTGNAGANTIYGAGGLDFIWGGAGADTFVYGSTRDSIAGTSDRIMDLETIDKIDLSRIDANTALSGNQAFQLVSSLSAATTDGAGRAVLRYDANHSWTLLELDVNGDGRADSRIVLMGDHMGHANWAW